MVRAICMMLGSIKRIVAIALGIGGAANGAFMLIAPPLWYDSVPASRTPARSIRTSSQTSASPMSSQASRCSHARGDRVIGLRRSLALPSCAGTPSSTCSTSRSNAPAMLAWTWVS